ncbi:hypothetical protein [Streptomyces acidiscabies]|uniref:hypothetical protein n=1 Tax=Streptomyces acidiscabies TaxID=42234 RepID=UPI0015C0ACFC|nr:hypothetical protein [Streptomyces acidiscabies]MBZ3909919.1 hypothetical protein [Streptomyces acidiscabies]
MHTPPGRASGLPGTPHSEHSRSRTGLTASGTTGRTGTGDGILSTRRRWSSAAGEWTTWGSPAVRAVRTASALAPRANHSSTSGASRAHSAADRNSEGAVRLIAARRMTARERVGGGSELSGGTSPRVNAAHQSSARAVRLKNVRVTQSSVPEGEATFSCPRLKCPAA